MKKKITTDDVIKEVSEMLAEADGDFLEDVANACLTTKVRYLGDGWCKQGKDDKVPASDVIAQISDVLCEADDFFIEQIANSVLINKVQYLDDEDVFEQEELKPQAKYVCPHCGNTNSLEVVVRVWAKLTQNDNNFQTDTENIEDTSHDWDGNSLMRCLNCETSGKAWDFFQK
jgi:hypothetical protein